MRKPDPDLISGKGDIFSAGSGPETPAYYGGIGSTDRIHISNFQSFYKKS